MSIKQMTKKMIYRKDNRLLCVVKDRFPGTTQTISIYCADARYSKNVFTDPLIPLDGKLFRRSFVASNSIRPELSDVHFYHRIEKPAHIVIVDRKIKLSEWYYEGVLHREYGPAITHDGDTVHNDGSILPHEMWYVMGTNITKEIDKWFAENPDLANWKAWTNKEKTLFKLKFM